MKKKIDKFTHYKYINDKKENDDSIKKLNKSKNKLLII